MAEVTSGFRASSSAGATAEGLSTGAWRSWLWVFAAAVVITGGHLLASKPAQEVLSRGGAERAQPSERENAPRRPDRQPPEQPLLRDKLRLGQAASIRPPQIAFIAHDDFRELVARQSSVEQAALQRETDPTQAPLIEDPTLGGASPQTPVPEVRRVVTPPPAPPLPVPTLRVDSEPAPVEAPQMFASEAGLSPLEQASVRARSARPEAMPARSDPDSSAPLDQIEPTPSDKSREAAEPSDSAEPAEQPDAAQPAPSATPGPEVPPRPTAAPRDEAEVMPTVVKAKDLTQDPGTGVYAGPGLQIQPRKLRLLDVGASGLLASPQPITVSIFFNADGKVDQAVLHSSTGYADIDEARRNNLFKWTAQGEQLQPAGVVVRELRLIYSR